QRAQFEALLLEVAEYAEEWLTSAQSIGLARRMPEQHVMPLERRPVRVPRPGVPPGIPPSGRPASAPRSANRRPSGNGRVLLRPGAP
ncbi:MAG: hypothetical protein M3170_11130, partial [Candidatus Dormibacteraeota bacterium]|nr:hypothetical protein [Candidatus Dormibacteraeota bacterium]MDQ6922144.1 hypothetical protein [Candidatus Dormibacteraeota bacterium]